MAKNGFTLLMTLSFFGGAGGIDYGFDTYLWQIMQEWSPDIESLESFGKS